MSKFVTQIPVDVHGVLALLPARATPLDVRFDPEAEVVSVEWDDDDLVTPYTFPVEYGVEVLKAMTLPKGVVVRKNATPKPSAPDRRFTLSKADPQELPGGPTTKLVPTARKAAVAGDPGKRAKDGATDAKS